MAAVTINVDGLLDVDTWQPDEVELRRLLADLDVTYDLETFELDRGGCSALTFFGPRGHLVLLVDRLRLGPDEWDEVVASIAD